jgi:energy-coupling factor transport system ATP-binding protein
MISQEEYIIEAKGLSFFYPGAESPVLRNVDLRLRRGEWLAILGANGSGKSTLAKHFNALLLPTQGACFVCGLDTKSAQGQLEARKNVTLVFQNPDNQIVAAIVEEDVAFGPENLGIPSVKIQERVRKALKITGLYEVRTKPTYTLSGGQKQRLAIAGAIAMEPACMVLDEATSMLDPKGRREINDVLCKLHRGGMTLVSITHRLEEIVACDQCIVLSKGTKVWEGVPKDLLAMGEGLIEWGLRVPPLVELCNRLKLSGVLPKDILPKIDEMVDALCP